MRLSPSFVAGVFALAALSGRPAAQAPDSAAFVAGEILVKFAPGLVAADKAEVHRAARGTVVVETGRTNVARVRVGTGNEAAAIARYRRLPGVLYAERNVVRSIPRPVAHGDFEVMPADFHFKEQWALHNSGQPFYCVPFLSTVLCFYQGTPDADVDAPEAWGISRGSAAVTVAIIDSGVDYTHPDLAPNYAGGDDFVSGDGDPMDDNGHGTHVAGIVAAAMNNLAGTPAEEEGVVGVAPNVRFRAYKVCRANGTCDDFTIQQAIARAIADGANIINLSLGSSEYSQSLDDAVQEAWNAGLVVVAAAGNDGTSAPFYPAALDNVVSVGAFDEDHARATFSNYGSWVDLSAPGNVIISAERLAACVGSSPGATGCYRRRSGTSMAAPHVAGAAALVWSRSDVTSNAEVVDILLGSADGDGAGGVRLDAWTSRGGLNLHDAIAFGLTNLPPVADAGTDRTITDTDGDGFEQVTLDGSASSDRDGSLVSYVWREGNLQIAQGPVASVWLPLGPHALTLEVTDNEGSTGADTTMVTVKPANEVTVAASTPKATEAGPVNGAFTIARTGGTGAALTVHLVVSGTAAAASDYLQIPPSVTIDAGASTAAVAIAPIDDATVEIDETVVLTLAPSTAYSLGSAREAVVTIVSDDLPPDLVVAALTATATAGADTDIVVTDTTRNGGKGPAPASNTGFYLSSNTAFDPSDVFLGARAVPGLAPAAVHTASTTLRVPPATAVGVYYVFARADDGAVVQESLENNNLFPSGVVRIGPDLVVSALTAPRAAAAGTSFDVSVTTRNQGGGGAAPSATRFYLSSNSILDAADALLGARSVPALGPAGADAAVVPLLMPAGTPAGAYYVIARADGAGGVAETTENNNDRASAPVTVGPDLIVTAVSIPPTAVPGAPITAADSTKNQGSGPAGASSTGFYLSIDTIFSASDVFLGSRPVGELAAGAMDSGSVPLQIPLDTAPGTYYVIARADWNEALGETAETNNTRASGFTRIGGDLLLTLLTAPAFASAGGVLAVSDTTANAGAATIGGSETGFYLSPSGIPNAPGNIFLGSRVVGALGASQTSTASTSLMVPAGTPAGRYYVIGVADWNNAAAEGHEGNNTRVSTSIRLGPDLVVTTVTAPSSAVAGTAVTVGETTRNQGGDPAAASVTSFYLSSNVTFDAGDVLLGTRAVALVDAGAASAGSITIEIPGSAAAGTWFIIARADSLDAVAEALEDNNTQVRAISIAAR